MSLLLSFFQFVTSVDECAWTTPRKCHVKLRIITFVYTRKPGLIGDRRNCTDAANSLFFVFYALITKMGLFLVFQPSSGGKSEKSPNCIAFWRSPFLSVWWRLAWHFIGNTAIIYSFSFFLLEKCISYICNSLDFDECKRNFSPCHVNAYCLNTIGSFVCRCHTGYIGDGTNCKGK